MDITFYLAIFGAVMVFHFPLAFFTSKEIMDYPLWPRSKKTIWILFSWLVPFISFMVVNKKLNLRTKGGNTAGGDTYTGGGSGD